MPTTPENIAKAFEQHRLDVAEAIPDENKRKYVLHSFDEITAQVLPLLAETSEERKVEALEKIATALDQIAENGVGVELSDLRPRAIKGLQAALAR